MIPAPCSLHLRRTAQKDVRHRRGRMLVPVLPPASLQAGGQPTSSSLQPGSPPKGPIRAFLSRRSAENARGCPTSDRRPVLMGRYAAKWPGGSDPDPGRPPSPLDLATDLIGRQNREDNRRVAVENRRCAPLHLPRLSIELSVVPTTTRSIGEGWAWSPSPSVLSLALRSLTGIGCANEQAVPGEGPRVAATAWAITPRQAMEMSAVSPPDAVRVIGSNVLR
jgi:hypothetical protein